MNEKNIRPVSSLAFCVSALLTLLVTQVQMNGAAGTEFDGSLYLFHVPALIVFVLCAAIIFRYQAIFEKEKALPKEE